MRKWIRLCIFGLFTIGTSEVIGQDQETIISPRDGILERNVRQSQAFRPVGTTEKDLKIRSALQEPISSPEDPETTFEDYLNHLKKSTISAEMPQGIPIYVNPLGLHVAGQTMRSPAPKVQDIMPAGLALRKVLGELGLAYQVQSGLLAIDSKEANEEFQQETLFLILKELTDLKRELGELQEEVQTLRDPDSSCASTKEPQK